MSQALTLPSEWLNRPIRILLLGAGGTGGEVLHGLVRIHTMLNELDHPGGLDLTLMDGDTFSRWNIGRQRCYPTDTGCNKASVLIQRINIAYGLAWRGIQSNWSPGGLTNSHTDLSRYDLLISCVDRASVRIEIAKAGKTLYDPILWMDCGNGQYTGQCVLGHLGRKQRVGELRLPHVFDLYPELSQVDDDSEPSCSSQQALRSQDLFTNSLLANAALTLLWRLLRTGRLDSHGVLIDTQKPMVTALPIDPKVWEFYRARPARPPKRRKSPESRRRRPLLAAPATRVQP